MTTLRLLVAQVLSIAAIQILVGWWVKTRLENSVKHEYDRRLEQFKSRETLAVEIAKRRVAVLAEAWTKISVFEARCWQHSKKLARRLLVEVRACGASGIPAELPVGHKEVFDLLTEHLTVEIPDDRIEEIQQEGADEQKRLLEAADELDEFLIANRFWVGADLDEELREYASQVKEAFVALSPAEEDRKEFVRLLRIVRSKRWDARALVARLGADSEHRDGAI